MTLSIRRALGGIARDVETERFVSMVRNTVLVALLLVSLSELAALWWPQFPQDLVGTGIMAASLVIVAAMCTWGGSRALVGGSTILMFGVLGWYVARAIGDSGGLHSLHRDAIYGVLAGAHALLLFSAAEFTAVTIVFVGSLALTSVLRGDTTVSQLGLTGFYIASFYCMAMVGITARARLKRSEHDVRRQLEHLNETLRSEVDAQVERIRRAEVLGRYLPAELSEQVLAGERGDQLAHGHRDVAILCATPVGFLETLTPLETEQVASLVNSFVSSMSRAAFEHGGVIERIVGPRITVLFGSLEPIGLGESVTNAVAMARELQRSCNMLLRRWEHDGLPVRLRMAIGIAAGPSVVGTFGSERRVEYSALGEAMVRAHRLAATAIPGEIRLDSAAAPWVDQTEIAEGEHVEFAPGKPEPTYVVDPHRDAADAPSSDQAEPESPLQAALLATSVAHLPLVESSDRARPSRVRPVVLEPGRLFDGRYRIEERIGRGGTATVYRAHHVALDQPRALKLLHPDQLAAPGAVEQLRREAEATSRIHHPNVVQLHDFGRSLEGHYYLALDFVDGESLAARLARNGALELRQALQFGAGMLHALQAAHELRLIHRDLKPGNVLIDARGRVRVTDFGMAQPLHAHRTVTDTIAGTPAYMSPEQCTGRPLDGRTDLFSFGVTLYHLISGHLPYRDTSGDPFELALTAERVPLSERVPSAPDAICTLIERCMAREPDDRPASALELLHQLDVETLLTETARRAD